MKFEFIRFEKKGRMAIITIDRQEVMNAIHPLANRELSHAFDHFSEDANSWVAIITGAGKKAFSAGNDLKFQAEKGLGAIDWGKNGFAGISRRFDCFKPIIAAVNGLALGGGFEIALASDIIIGAENASFGLPEPRVGLLAGTGVHRLPRQIPHHLAMEMILTGRRISAVEAHRLGIVNEVVPLDQLMPTAEKKASDVLECAPLAVQAAKQSALLGMENSLEEALSRTYPLVEKMRASEDAVEGPRAFSAKRKPQWKGR